MSLLSSSTFAIPLILDALGVPMRTSVAAMIVSGIATIIVALIDNRIFLRDMEERTALLDCAHREGWLDELLKGK